MTLFRVEEPAEAGGWGCEGGCDEGGEDIAMFRIGGGGCDGDAGRVEIGDSEGMEARCGLDGGGGEDAPGDER